MLLLQDMLEVSRHYCCSIVSLNVSFMRGLHPFFPPSVEVVRPHFKGACLPACPSGFRAVGPKPCTPALNPARLPLNPARLP